MNNTTRHLSAAVLLGALAFFPGPANGSSHSDAPLVSQDPDANITDVYAFVGTKYDDAGVKVLNVIVHVHPYCEPGAGAIYDRFADDALYSIHIANPVTGEGVRRYDFKFSNSNPDGGARLKNKDTILSYGLGTEFGPILDVNDARHNFTQTYSVTRVNSNGNETILGSDLLTPPPNVGLRTTPFYNDSQTGRAISGAVDFGSLDKYTQQTLYALPSGVAVFAGQREDGFYSDIPGFFDLLDSRIIDNNGNLADGLGQDGGGVDGMKGYNVLAFAIQIPVDSLPSFEYTAPFADLANALPANGTANGVGVYATVGRPRKTIRRVDGDPKTSGPYIQVNRMGNPLFNELFIALRNKDKYSRTQPVTDANKFIDYALSPEIASLFNTVFGTSLVTSGRTDLADVFIPDVLRVDTTTAAVPLPGQIGFNRLGFFGGDTILDSGAQTKSSGWPNGRRPGDDVVDIALSLVASGPVYSVVTIMGDNVAANDQVFNQIFPYSGTPHAGPSHSKDSGINDD
ncbi:MAG: DUF4331 domain-containing protein [Candidatus Hydrogenedentes bacterium]|nr:DUF4331 domain-containing protein [Candidatus Hydrogenedentota bacterium]